jgi:hypothetical protein
MVFSFFKTNKNGEIERETYSAQVFHALFPATGTIRRPFVVAMRASLIANEACISS